MYEALFPYIIPKWRILYGRWQPKQSDVCDFYAFSVMLFNSTMYGNLCVYFFLYFILLCDLWYVFYNINFYVTQYTISLLIWNCFSSTNFIVKHYGYDSNSIEFSILRLKTLFLISNRTTQIPSLIHSKRRRFFFLLNSTSIRLKLIILSW